jgi:LPXTG-motif cell wall-anchored protein
MFQKLIRSAALAAFTVLAAMPLVAQNADQNTAGPTKNDLKLRLTEPREGQEISGTTIRVAVDYNRGIFGAGSGTRFGEKNFPHPIFDVFVDNSLKQSLNGGEANVATIADVPLGKHKVVVIAKNISGEVIDRSEVNVTNIAIVSTESTTSTTTMTTSSEPAPAPPPPAPAPVYSAPPAPAPAPVAEMSTSGTASDNNLPATGSNAPATALLGLTLLAGGVWTARRTR